MLKGVTFDLWFTLLPSSRQLDSIWRKMRNHETYRILLEQGYLIDYHDLKKRIQAFDTRLQKMRQSQGIDFTNDEQVCRLIDALTQNGQKNQQLHNNVKETFTQVLLKYPPPLAHGVTEMLAALKADGWKIGLISNTGKTPGWTFRELFKRWNIFQYFDALTFSDEVQLYKPNPKIFQIAECQLRLQPQELVHVGDMISADVCGALDAGWQAIHFTRFLDLRYLDENARDALARERCSPHEIAHDYEEIVQKLNHLRDNSREPARACMN